MGILIIRNAELKNLSPQQVKHDFLIKVHHRSDGETLPTDKLPGEFHVMLTEFQGHFGEATYAHSQNGRQANFENNMDLNGNIPFGSPYCISLLGEVELRRRIHKALCCSWILLSQSDFSSPVLFMPKPDGKPRMCLD